MSDLLTHWAVMDDCRRLMPFVAGVAPEFGESLNRHHYLARLGSNTRTEGHWIPPILRWTRQHWDDPAMHPEAEIKLAFCVAGLAHTACDVEMKQLRIKTVLAEENSPDPTPDDVERLVYAYHDTHVFRKVYRDGAEEPFNTFMMADIQTGAGQKLEKMAKALFQLAMMGTRTMVQDERELDRDFLEGFVQDTARRALASPDAVRRIIGSRGLCRQSIYDWLREHRQRGGDGPDWDTIKAMVMPDMTDAKTRLDNLLLNELRLYVDHQRLVRVYHQPDPAKMALYGIETEFYDADDPAIRAARAVQDGEAPPVDEIRAAVQPGANRSYYGRALETAMEYQRQGTVYWLGKSQTIETPNLGEGKALQFRHRHDTEADRLVETRF